MPLDVMIEAVLFYKAAPQKISHLRNLFKVENDADWATALLHLRTRLSVGALRLIETENDLALATAPELSTFVEAMQKAEQKSDIGKAGAETLAIILYKEPITRAEIDRIRGVNSTFILRNLMMKGLIERKTSGNTNLFSITPALLAHLGIEKKGDLPEFSNFMSAIDTFAADQKI
jgi:segregation and condensation protein B